TFLLSKDAERFGGKIPLSIRCDNTRDSEMIPSDLSDFNLYGGIYRYLNLVYLPEVSVASLKIVPTLDTKMRKASLDISGLFYNPTDIRQASVEVFVKKPQGEIVYAQSFGDVTALGEFSIQGINLDNPYLWDVISPQFYTCEVVVTAN